MSTFTIAILLTFVFFAGYMYGIRRIGNSAIQSFQKNASKLIPMFYIEVEENNYYVYDKETSNFICQGKTMDDVANALNNAKKTFAIVATPIGNDFQLQWFVNGKFKQFD
jgi:hypothetical protein